MFEITEDMTQEERAAREIANGMMRDNYPMRAVAATPRYFLAQRFPASWRRLSPPMQKIIAEKIQTLLGAPTGDQGPSISGQRYA